MAIEFLIILLVWTVLSKVVELSFGIPPYISFFITLALLLLYDFIVNDKQPDNKEG